MATVRRPITIRETLGTIRPAALSLATVMHVLGCRPMGGNMARDWDCCRNFFLSRRCGMQLRNVLADLSRAYQLMGAHYAVFLPTDVAELATAIRGLQTIPADGAPSAVDTFLATVEQLCNRAVVELAHAAGCQDIVTGNPH
jgi:hypothetical protein